MCGQSPPLYISSDLSITKTGRDCMGRYLVERSFPKGLSISINDEGAALCRTIVLNNTEDGVTWIHSYVSDDRKKTYCICDAPSPEAIRRASRRNNLPIDRITDVCILNPYFYH